MDRGDWFLNLTYRQWLDKRPNPEGESYLREFGPVLRRAEEAHQFGLRLGVLFHEPDTSAIFEALNTGSVRSGIEPLQVAGLYLFEQMLPQEVRDFGATFKPGLRGSDGAPPAFNGRLDHAFSPQMTQRFVRVDLSMPPDVLRADLDLFIRSELEALAKIGGPQPFREAAGLRVNGVSDLGANYRVGLLQFLDLDRWQRAEGLSLPLTKVRGLFTAHSGRDRELRAKVEMARSSMKLRAWFARLERSADIKRRART